MDTGYKIAEARIAKGWSQQDLANEIGTTQQCIQRYESGARDIRASMIVALSEALCVTPSYLLGIDPELEGVAGSNTFCLVGDEKELIEAYRSCTPPLRDNILTTARVFAGQSRDEAVRHRRVSRSA